jgi:hypothetical protein
MIGKLKNYTMKKLLLLIFLPTIVFGQIEIDEIEKKAIEPIPFDGSFMKLPIASIDESVRLGLIGEKITLIDVYYFDVKLMDGRTSASFKDQDKFKNKTFVITNAEREYGSTLLTIKNDSGEFKWKPSSSSKYVFNKYVQKIKEKLESKSYIPLHNKTNLKDLNGSMVNIDGETTYVVTKVSFSKFSYGQYGIKVELNDSISLKYISENSYDQPRIFDGTKMIPQKGWIYLNDDGFSRGTFIENDIFERFKVENQKWISNIREQKIAIGMTEKQCRYAWGMPDKSYGSLAGYDEVFDWGGKSLYFKADKLALIK